MRLQVLRAFFLQGGAIAEVGSVVEMIRVDAMAAINAGRAKLAEGETLPPPEPMTVQNTTALVPDASKPAKSLKGKAYAGQ